MNPKYDFDRKIDISLQRSEPKHAGAKALAVFGF